MKISEIYQAVTNSIVAELESGTVPWVCPWRRGQTSGIMPTNAATHRAYSGINIPILWHAADSRGYATNRWMTFKQAIEKGACVRKGEHGTQIVFTKKLTPKEEDEEDKARTMLFTFTVFNIAQIDGLPEESGPQVPPEHERHEAADRLIAAMGADIRYCGNQACYVPSEDFVALPPRSSFTTTGGIYATAFHELGHWSGHKTRLDRNLTTRFGTQAYAAEELVAELTSAFLCAHQGIKGELRHASYIDSWLKLLRSDDRAIFTASSKASQAADFLRGFSENID
jgi:antirestriction protein ArdC